MSVSSHSDNLNDDTESTTILDYNPNDYYDDTSLSSSVQRILKKQVFKVSNKKRIYRTVKFEDGKKKSIKIDFFETPNYSGRYIVDAITGHICAPHKVGSTDENLYYSVLFATGETGREASLLFFDNPQQFERHFYVEVSQEIKERWLNKATLARLPSHNKQ